jgi:hypothetical protein
MDRKIIRKVFSGIVPLAIASKFYLADTEGATRTRSGLLQTNNFN